ncbi:MAG: LURP-one-related family protein [Chloroflexi bacterium]|nr:LURP-one-related family protein [Chloroflexota bacterium]MCC6893409.1 LURP-one-related family protein [Anaerolineae bacterium]
MTRRFLLRQIIFAIGHDSWVMDERDQKIFLIDHKTVALRKTYVMYDTNKQEVLKIQHQPLHLHKTITIEHQGKTVAQVQKAWLTLLRDKWNIQMPGGEDLVAQGNLLDHEYSIMRGGETVAQISKHWFTIRESYGVEVYDDRLSAIMIALTVAIDDMMHSTYDEAREDREG